MFKTVSYYVQQMYAQNKGTNVLPMTMDKKFIAGQEGQNGLFASSVYDKNSNEIIIKVINTGKTPQPVSINLNGIKGERSAQTITLTCNEMDAENSISQPDRIVPQNGTLACKAGKKSTVLDDTISPMTFRLYKVKK